MMKDFPMRDVVNMGGGPIYMVYKMEPSDAPKNWLHEGISHACSHVWQLKVGDVIRPFKTQCDVHVTTHIEIHTAPLYNCVPVPTTCLWCVAGMRKGTS